MKLQRRNSSEDKIRKLRRMIQIADSTKNFDRLP
ncbi:hypothetical protein LSS_06764 [Leptospira santarosai serovar Shermani str. LT 821]|uniref:Uncharacterized protein n=1 Tax=Leptospira santarosai serovar Shermani str. LT 821 TaxID=758847 RepID=K8YAR0_9LEPT|nr:hypothetical protein LSS_06764 [Leptospira santarosai serovar Shermani str. LT 821]